MGWHNHAGETPTPPTPTRPIAFLIHGVVGARVAFEGGAPRLFRFEAITDVNGAAVLPAVDVDISVGNLHVTAAGDAPYDLVLTIPPKRADGGQNWDFKIGPWPEPLRDNQVQLPALTSLHFDASTLTFEQLAAYLKRGSIWTARLNLPFGPRPGQDDNILAMDYYEWFSPEDRKRMIAAYGPTSPRKYTACPTGPVIDGGYHGQYPLRDTIPTQAEWDAYLDALQELWDAGIAPVYHAKPDGWENNLAGMDALDALHRQPRAQKLLRIVVYPGWEPSGDKYGWRNAIWVYWCKRGAEVFPNALRLLHMPADLDAPTGQDDETQGFTNGQCWQNVAPYIHGFAAQVGGYVNGAPLAEFLPAFRDYIVDMGKRFRDPSVHQDWPKACAWLKPLLVIYYEGASYVDYWKNAPEEESKQIGDMAIASGADGAMDGVH